MKYRHLVVLLWLAACGATDGANDTDDTDDSDADGSDGVDGGPVCELNVFLPESPAPPGSLAEISAYFGSNGTLAWTIERPDESLQEVFQEQSEQLRSFVLDEIGTWKVRVEVVGSNCSDRFFEALIHVEADDPVRRDFVVRFQPPPGARVAPWQQTYTVPGGGHYELDPAGLPDSLWLEGSLFFEVTGEVGEDRSAQLTLAPSLGGVPVELHADASGHFAGAIVNGPYELEIVPYDWKIAPVRLHAEPEALLAGLFSIDRGQPVSGTVFDADGVAVAGAQVALSSGDLPATFAYTREDGSFDGWARDAGTLAVRVAPTDGRAGLVADAALGLQVDGGLLTIALPDAAVVPVSFQVTTSGNLPLADAWIRLVPKGTGGSVQQGGAGGATRRAGRHVFGPSGIDGSIDVDLPAGAYTVVVEPPTGAGEAMDSQEIVVVAPAPGAYAVKSQKASNTPVKVLDSDGAAVGGARLVAVSRGLAGVGAGVASPATFSSDDVTNLALLPLVRGVAYDLEIDAPAGSGLVGQHIFVPAGSPLVEVRLDRAIQLRGTLRVPDLERDPPYAGVPRVRVTAYCSGCDTPDQVLAETATDDEGTFRLLIPDPGVRTK